LVVDGRSHINICFLQFSFAVFIRYGQYDGDYRSNFDPFHLNSMVTYEPLEGSYDKFYFEPVRLKIAALKQENNRPSRIIDIIDIIEDPSCIPVTIIVFRIHSYDTRCRRTITHSAVYISECDGFRFAFINDNLEGAKKEFLTHYDLIVCRGRKL